MADAAVFGAFADGVDIGVGSFEVVVNDDPAVDLETGEFAEVGVGADAGGDDDQIGGDFEAAGEADAGGVAVAEDGGGALVEKDFDAEGFDFRAEIAAADGVKLAFHQAVAKMDDGDVAALDLQTASGFQAEEPAADDDGFRAGLGAVEDPLGIGEGTPGADAVLLDAFDAGDERLRAGGNEELVVGGDAAVVAGDRPHGGFDGGDADAEAEGDLVFEVPGERIQRDVVNRLLAGEDARQENAVVVDMGLIAEDRDFEVMVVAKDLFETADAGHAVTDDDELLFELFAGHYRWTPDFSTRTADCLKLGSREMGSNALWVRKFELNSA